jgi:leucyl-tRNA synthetase
MTIDETITIAIQVLGKLRGEIEVSKDEEKEIILKKAKENESIQKWIEGKEIIKEIYVPGKIVNFVVK